jgi:hypothetical protein
MDILNFQRRRQTQHHRSFQKLTGRLVFAATKNNKVVFQPAPTYVSYIVLWSLQAAHDSPDFKKSEGVLARH